MTTKSILAVLIGPDTDRSVLHCAGTLASAFSAHIAVTHVRDLPRATAVMGYEGVQPYINDELEADLNRRADEVEAESRANFDAFVERSGFETRTEPALLDRPTVSWESVEDYGPDIVRRRGGGYDIIVLGQPAGGPSNLDLLSVEAALFATGRPVLVVPEEVPATIGEKVLIGWNRSGPAARAFHAAKALLLERARRVRLLSVTTGAKQGPPAEDIRDNLAWHDIQAEIRELSPDYRSIGEVLLAEASAIGADLLVMGAYSRSRLRQLILGGVTQHVLTRAPMPVFMAH